MRYQLATFGQPDGEIPLDPRDGLSCRQRAQSMEMLSKRKMSMDKLNNSRDRANTKGKPKPKKSTGYKIEVEKTNEAKPPAPSLVPVSSEAKTPVSSEAKPNKNAIKKTKRRAPAPPSALSGVKKPVNQETGSNPFEDGDSNPFLDDDDDDDTGNPFLDDGEDESGNPFLDDDDNEEKGNPFL